MPDERVNIPGFPYPVIIGVHKPVLAVCYPVTGIVTESSGGGGGGGGASLSQTSTGSNLVWYDSAVGGGHAFSTANWDYRAVDRWDLVAVSTHGYLQADPDSGTAWGVIENTAVSSGGEHLVVAEIMSSSATANFFGVGSLTQDGASDGVGITTSVNRSPELVSLRTINNASNATIDSTQPAARDDAVWYTLSAYSNAGQVIGYDFLDDIEMESTQAVITGGRPGFIGGETVASVQWFSRRWYRQDRNVTVTGMASGRAAQLQTSTGGNLGTEVTSTGGNVSLDMLKVKPWDVGQIVVRASSGGVTLATFTSPGSSKPILGGMTYAFSSA